MLFSRLPTAGIPTTEISLLELRIVGELEAVGIFLALGILVALGVLSRLHN